MRKAFALSFQDRCSRSCAFSAIVLDRFFIIDENVTYEKIPRTPQSLLLLLFLREKTEHGPGGGTEFVVRIQNTPVLYLLVNKLGVILLVSTARPRLLLPMLLAS